MNNKLIITGIQTGLFWEDKRANLQMLEEKILGINQKTELIILPEMFSTGFSMQAEKTCRKYAGRNGKLDEKNSRRKKQYPHRQPDHFRDSGQWEKFLF